MDDPNLIAAAVLAGQGVALCPLAMLQDDLESGRLIQLSDITVMESFNYYLVEHAISDTATARATHAFRTWLFR
jgi:DNA-binding transcriptional LysR family regulator